ncbi:MAG: hypothetical protein KDE14_01730 [Rhodobacteraceae bacterium]|nr:hypothetical protein [Paracoccaceae bacterium]
MVDRLSGFQIATLRQVAICTANGGQVALTRAQREAMVPLWRAGAIEVWHRLVPDEGSRGPFYRPSSRGWALIKSLFGWSDAQLGRAA